MACDCCADDAACSITLWISFATVSLGVKCLTCTNYIKGMLFFFFRTVLTALVIKYTTYALCLESIDRSNSIFFFFLVLSYVGAGRDHMFVQCQ